MKNFTFIDLFAGIGGFRIAMEQFGGRCVFSSEINPHACQMYEANYNDTPHGDITKIKDSDIPDFDILCAGFPCQAFSIAGKKMGFEDTRGTLFFEICRILKAKKPKVVFLENVKNLTKHDNGKTLAVILKSLQDLGYFVSYKILNAKDFGVPQNRERIIIVGSLEKEFNFSKLNYSNKSSIIEDILETDTHYLDECSYTLLDKTEQNKSSGLVFAGFINKTLRKGTDPLKTHLSRVHRQPNRIYRYDGCHPTLSSQESAGRYYILLKNNRVRKLTINECYKLMGFPPNFKLIGAKNQLYQRIGNSVCVSMMVAVTEQITKQFDLS